MKWIIGAGLFASASWAQVSVNVPEYGVRVNSGAGGSSVSIGKSNAANTAGSIEGDVEMEGVAVINGEVFIDGEKVPKGKSSFVAKKSGKKYRILRDKDGNVSVTEN